MKYVNEDHKNILSLINIIDLMVGNEFLIWADISMILDFIVLK